MSLILDALKRSDRERRIAAGEPFATSVPRRRKMGGRPLLLLVVLALLAAAAFWFWRTNGWAKLVTYLSKEEPATAQAALDPADSQTEEVTPAAQTASERAPEREARPAAKQNRNTPANPTTPALVATASPSVQAPQPRAPTTRSEPEQRVTPAPEQDGSRRTSRRLRTEPEPPQEPAPLEIYELPMGIRLQIPQLTMNVHVYAGEPEDRFVLINMQRVEEGDELEGVIARSIRPDGILLEFQGHQFLLRRP